MQMQHSTFLQGASELQPLVPKRCQSLKLRVKHAIARYSRSEILVYLHGIVYLLLLLLITRPFPNDGGMTEPQKPGNSSGPGPEVVKSFVSPAKDERCKSL